MEAAWWTADADAVAIFGALDGRAPAELKHWTFNATLMEIIATNE